MRIARRAAIAAIAGSLAAIGRADRSAAADMDLRPADGSSFDPRDALPGSWRGHVAGERRARIWVVDAATGAPDGSLRLSSGWGFEGTPPTRIGTATLAREGGATVLRLVTGARSVVVGTWTEPGRFEGTIEYPQTDSRERSIKPLVLSKLDTDGEERPQVRERARPGTVMVLYVGAWNCQSCIWWKKRNVGAEERALLARVSLREVDVPNFRDLGHDPAWPEDLKAIRDRYRIANGTPRFYVFVDGKLAKQSFGGASWQRDILPVLQRLVGGSTG